VCADPSYKSSADVSQVTTLVHINGGISKQLELCEQLGRVVGQTQNWIATRTLPKKQFNTILIAAGFTDFKQSN
jgi:hypothetical protein